MPWRWWRCDALDKLRPALYDVVQRLVSGDGRLRRTNHLTLTDKQGEMLRAWAHGQRVEHRLRVRASIIWELACGAVEAAVAETLQVSVKTVRKWRSRFVGSGLDGLHDRPRSGAPPKFEVAQRCEVIATACDEPLWKA